MPSFLRHRLTPSRITLLYAGFAALWIVASDELLNLVTADPALMGRINTIKGLAFVIATAGLLYLLLGSWCKSLITTNAGDAATPRFRRRYWVLTLISLALLAPLLGFGLVLLHGPQLEREAYANLEAIADLKANQIIYWLAERQGDGDALAADPGFAGQVDRFLRQGDAAQRADIVERLAVLRAAYDYEDVALLDTQGQSKINLGDHVELYARLKPLIAQALASGRTQRSDIYQDETGQTHLDWVVPITRAEPEGRRPVATIVLHVEPRRLLFPLIQRWPTASPTAESLLVRREGESVLFLNELRHQPGAALTQRQPLNNPNLPAAVAMRERHAGIMAGIDYRGVPVLAAFRPVTGTNWYLVAKIDRAEVMMPLNWLVFWVSLVALFAVAAITAAVLGLWRQQQRVHHFELLAQAAEQDRLLRKFYELPFIGMAFTSPENKRWLQFNDRLCEILGYPPEELVNMTWAEITHPDDLAANTAEFERVLRGESDGYTTDKRFIRPDGAVVFATVDVKCVRHDDGTVKTFITTINDITERQRASEHIRRLNRLYEMLSNINQTIVRRKNPSWMLGEACQIAVRDGGFRMAWIGQLNPKTGQVQPVAEAGQTGNYPKESHITLVGPRSEGPTGTALRTGKIAVCNNIAADPTMALWREAALALGYRASIALPLLVQNTVWGALNLYTDQTGFFDDGEIALLEELAGDIAFALEIAEADAARLQTEQALQESQDRFRRATEEAPFPIMIHAEDGEVLALSRAWTEISGYTRADIPTIADWTGQAYGKRQQAVQADIAQLYDLPQRKAEGEYQITCKDGSQRDWEFSSVGLGQLADGRRSAISMAADVTERNWAMTTLRQRVWQYRQLFEANPHPMWVYDLETLRFLAVNDAAIQHYGFSQPEFLAMTIADIRPPEDVPRLLENIAQVQNHQVDEAGVWKHRKQDGSLIDVEIVSHVLEFAGRRAEVVLAHDVTESLRAEERLRQAATVFENTREGIMITGPDERILRVNRAFCELTGYTEEEAQGQTPRLLHSDQQSPEFYAALWATLRDTGHWQGEVWNRRKNGEIYPELLSISTVKNSAGAVTHYVGVFADLSQLKASEEQLDFLAHHDPLTGLPNRLLLSARLQHSIEVARRDGETLALLVLDLDRFKDVNDSYGHSAGDALLLQVAERLTHRLRGVDTVTRLGGDEFAVLLEELAQPQDAARVAMDILSILSEPWRLANDAEVRLGASLGISLFPEHAQTAEELLQQADAALYQAKSEGRGRFQYFSAALTQAARQRIELEARLRRAIGDQQLRVYYQPQVAIPSGRIVGAEALVRWQDPDHGLIPPGRFIPVAEETGLISAIGEWVLRETCRQGKAWLDAGLPPLTLAVNLSVHQLHHEDLATTVLQILKETGFPAEQLELELTESALMQREVEAVTILERLRGLGLHLAMDDFGTGYSSLAYLRRFPLDVLKIDKSFVDDLPRQREAMEIASTIIAMGHTLGLKVLAEGVETAEQLAFLELKGCDQYQGYLTSPPVPAAAFVELLTRLG
ncbi:MAG: EAL domain-containing protein [Candidatus Contendobacter sp.]|nr:EAL domain-containing protein [Candidatus Contendobacter sp.]